MRGFVRSRSYPIADLLGAEVEVGQTGLGGFGREYLVLEAIDGSRPKFKEFNSRPARLGERPSPVQQAVIAIRDELVH
jgi:hypothetical protein